ncbi:MAG: VOC family protein [Gemmatimonadetes bacterium]|nr:VOC family protein [Gemmatimonadota bacterium]
MKLHHVGVIVPAIEPALEHYRAVLQMEPTTAAVYDPIQDAKLIMIEPPGGGPGIELIEPASPASPVAKQAGGGGGLAHVCYEVDDIEAEVARQRQAGALTVQAPVPAVLFGGRRVAFLYLRTKHLIEMVEADSDGS